MQLKRFTDLGLRILMYLASRPKNASPVSVPELAQALSWNPNLVVKAAHFMVKANWLTASRGRNGGLRLAKSPDEYRIGDIVRALEGDDPLVDCKQPTCPFSGRCVLAGALREAEEAFWEKLNQFSLEELIAKPTANRTIITPDPILRITP